MVGAEPAARLGVITMALGHVVMVGVMTMTPVHIRAAGHDAARTLDIVGLVLSAHVAGMFALAPVFGWLTDRLGRRGVIALGTGLLLTACAVAGTAGQAPRQLAAGLLILGLGWSATLVLGLDPPERRDPDGAPGLGAGLRRSGDGSRGRLGRGAVGGDRGRVGISDAHAAGGGGRGGIDRELERTLAHTPPIAAPAPPAHGSSTATRETIC